MANKKQNIVDFKSGWNIFVVSFYENSELLSAIFIFILYLLLIYEYSHFFFALKIYKYKMKCRIP